MRFTLLRLLPALVLASSGIAEVPETQPATRPIYAEFTSELGAADVREVRLVVDGRDVTADAAITPLRVTYAPAEPLAAGEHVARVVVVDSLGREWAKEWSFQVEPASPILEQVWSEELLVEIERPPRRVRQPQVALRGWTQPGAEIVLRRDGGEVERVLASASGRFQASIALNAGDNAISLVARRLDTGDEGAEIALRVERILEKPRVDDDDGLVTKPPQRRIPVPRIGPPRAVLADSGLLLDPSSAPRFPEAGARAPARLERPPRAPATADDVGGRAPQDAEPISLPEQPGDPEPEGEVIITKPDDGDVLRQEHATVLGRAPAGWDVTILVDGMPRGEDRANPAGHFTIPRVEIGAGAHELVAEAQLDGSILRSAPVRVEVEAPSFRLEPASVALTSPQRSGSVARGNVQRVAGMAWDGAEVEIEVNGRVVAREIAGHDGRFDVDVPLESGINLLRVEAVSADLSRTARSAEYAVTSSGRASATPRVPGRAEGVIRAPVIGGGSRPRPSLPAGQLPAGLP